LTCQSSMWWARKLMPTIFVQGFQATSLLHGPPRFHADVARRSGTSAYIINMTSWYVFRAAPWLYWITPNNWQLSVSDGTILVCVIHDVSSCPARIHISPPIMFPAPTRKSWTPLLQQIMMRHHTVGTPSPIVSMNSSMNSLVPGRMGFRYSTEPGPIWWHCRRSVTPTARLSVPIPPIFIPLSHQHRYELASA